MNINKLKKYILLILTIILLAWLWHYMIVYRPWDIRIPVTKKEYGPDFAFKNVKIREISGPLTFFDLRSDKLELEPDKAVFGNVSGNIMAGNIPVFYFEASSVLTSMDKERSLLTNFSGEVLRAKVLTRVKGRKTKINDPLTWHVKAKNAVWQQKYKTITFNKPAELWNEKVNINATSFIYYTNYNLFIAGPDCEITTGNYKITCDEAALKEKLDLITMKGNIIFDIEEYSGRAGQAEFDYKNDVYLIQDDVIVKYEDMAINSGKIKIDLNSAVVNFEAGIKLAYKDILVHSDRALFDKEKNVIEFYDNIRSWQGKSMVEGDRMIFDVSTKEFISTGGRTKIIKTN